MRLAKVRDIAPRSSRRLEYPSLCAQRPLTFVDGKGHARGTCAKGTEFVNVLNPTSPIENGTVITHLSDIRQKAHRAHDSSPPHLARGTTQGRPTGDSPLHIGSLR